MLRHIDGCAGRIIGGDFILTLNEIDAIDRLVVRADVVVALGATRVIVKRDAGTDDIDKSGARVADCRFDDGHQLPFVAREAARDEGRAHQERERHGINRRISVGQSLFGRRAFISRRGELSFGESVDAVVLQHIDHVHAAAHHVRELA